MRAKWPGSGRQLRIGGFDAPNLLKMIARFPAQLGVPALK